MQHPTCTNLRVKSVKDALKIFTAVKLGLLDMVARHLDHPERQALCSGCVYVWEQKSSSAGIAGHGIKRFTDGRRWTNSQERDQFLFYSEKYSPPPDNLGGKSAEVIPPSSWKPLVKQTFSVWVKVDNGCHKKWHLTAYFSKASVDQLHTVDEVPLICNLGILEKVFICTRLGKNQRSPKEGSKISKTRTPSHSYSSSTQPNFEESRTYTTPPPLSSQDDSGNDNGAKGSQPFLPYQPWMRPPLNAIASFDHSDLLPSARQEEPNGYYPYSPSPQYLADLGASPSSHLSSAYNTFGDGYPMLSTPFPLNPLGYLPIGPAQNCTIPNSAICGMHLSSTIQYPHNPLNPMELPTLQNCPEPHVPTLSPSYFICRPAVNHRGLDENEMNLQMLQTNPTWLS